MLGKTFIRHVSVLNPQKWVYWSRGMTDNINDGSLTSNGLKKITSVSRFEGQPLEETHCGHLDPWSHSFIHHPQLMTMGESRPTHRKKLCLSDSALSSPQRSSRTLLLSVHLMLHFLIILEQELRILRVRSPNHKGTLQFTGSSGGIGHPEGDTSRKVSPLRRKEPAEVDRASN